MLDQLVQQLEHKLGSTPFAIQRPRRGDWQITAYRDHPSLHETIYASGHGDTLVDAIHDLLVDPQVAA